MKDFCTILQWERSLWKRFKKLRLYLPVPNRAILSSLSSCYQFFVKEIKTMFLEEIDLEDIIRDMLQLFLHFTNIIAFFSSYSSEK